MEKGDLKIAEKNDAKFGGVLVSTLAFRISTLAFRRGRFGAGGEVRRGQAPPGPAIPALIQLFNLKRPAPGGVRRILFHEKWSLGRPRVDLFYFLKGF